MSDGKKKTTDEKFEETMETIKSLAEQLAETKAELKEHVHTPDAHNPGLMRKPKK